MSPVGIALTGIFFLALLLGLVLLFRQENRIDVLREQSVNDVVVFRASVSAKTKGWWGWAPINGGPSGVELTVRRHSLQIELAGWFKGKMPSTEHFLPIEGTQMRIGRVPFPLLVRRRSIIISGTELGRPSTIAVYTQSHLDDLWLALRNAGIQSPGDSVS